MYLIPAKGALNMFRALRVPRSRRPTNLPPSKAIDMEILHTHPAMGFQSPGYRGRLVDGIQSCSRRSCATCTWYLSLWTCNIQIYQLVPML